MREQFFDRMKELGYDYNAISSKLGPGFSPTTLSRIANGERVPNRDVLEAILDLIEEVAGDALTKPVREHVRQVYYRAAAVAKPTKLFRDYLFDDKVEDVQARNDHQRRNELAARAAPEGESSDEEPSVGEELGEDHPAVQVHNEAVQLVEEAVEEQIPLVRQPLVPPDPPGDSGLRSTVEAILDRTDQILKVLRQSVARDIARLEAAEDHADRTGPPPGALPDNRPLPPPPRPQRPWAGATLAVVVLVVLTAGAVRFGPELLDRQQPADTGKAATGGPTTGGSTSPRQTTSGGDGGGGHGGGTSHATTAPRPTATRTDRRPSTHGSASKRPSSPPPVTDPPAEEFTASAPEHLGPADGSVLTNYPRNTTLEWARKEKAVSYRYEVECMCSGVWVTSFNDTTNGTSFTFDWYGDQQGRWHITAIAADGTESDTSNWWYFTYDTSAQAAPSS
jgi:hypothetical protein